MDALFVFRSMAQKEIITANNIRRYFDFRGASISQLRPGMLVAFRYKSPDRHIHDVNPLVYIIENQGDRIYGLNLHYNFALMGGMIFLKRQELEKKVGYHFGPEEEKEQGELDEATTRHSAQTGTKHVNAQTPTQKAVDKNKPQPKLTPQQQRQADQQAATAAKTGQKPVAPQPKQPEKPVKVIPKPRVPIQLLEHYQLQAEPITILRNYLFPRMSGIQKLVFKI